MRFGSELLRKLNKYLLLSPRLPHNWCVFHPPEGVWSGQRSWKLHKVLSSVDVGSPTIRKKRENGTEIATNLGSSKDECLLE